MKLVNNISSHHQANVSPVIKQVSPAPERIYVWNGERQIVNLTALMLNEQLCLVGERFNICLCPDCCAEITRMMMKKPYFLSVTSVQEEMFLNEQLPAYRQQVIKELTRIAITMKNKPFHKN